MMATKTNLMKARLATLVFISVANAQEPDYPRNETLYPLQGDISGSVLNLNCLPSGDETIDCETTRLMFVKPDVDDQPSDADLAAMVQLFDERLCAEVNLSDVSLDDPAIQQRIAEADPNDVENVERMLRFCTERDSESRGVALRQWLSTLQDGQRESCRLIFIHGSPRFNWDRGTGQWRSVNEGRYCGAVTVTTIESEDGTWWNYSTRTLVTDPDGEAPFPFQSCDLLAEEEPLVWASRGNAIRQNCQVIGESWTQ